MGFPDSDPVGWTPRPTNPRGLRDCGFCWITFADRGQAESGKRGSHASSHAERGFLCVCTTIAECDSFDAVADWRKVHLGFLRRFLPLSSFEWGVPSERWLNIMMNRIDPDLFAACFIDWFERATEPETWRSCASSPSISCAPPRHSATRPTSPSSPAGGQPSRPGPKAPSSKEKSQTGTSTASPRSSPPQRGNDKLTRIRSPDGDAACIDLPRRQRTLVHLQGRTLTPNGDYRQGSRTAWLQPFEPNEERMAAGVRVSFCHRSHGADGDGTDERLAAIAPVKIPPTYFATAASEANGHLIKFVWYGNDFAGEPRRRKMISRWASSHGSTIAGASLDGSNKLHESFDIPTGLSVQVSHPRRPNAGAFTNRLAGELEQANLEAGPGTIGAIIAKLVLLCSHMAPGYGTRDQAPR